MVDSGCEMDVITNFFSNITILGVLGTIGTVIVGIMAIIQGIDSWESLEERRKKRKEEAKEKEANPTAPKKTKQPSTTSSKNWLTVKVTRSKNQITFSQGANNRQSILLEQLPQEEGDATWQVLSKTLFCYKEIHNAHKAKETIHLRIMTDDNKLGFLPWHYLPDPETPKKRLIDNHWRIEVGPIHPDNYPNFNLKNIDNPLVVIPSNHEHSLMADRHFSLVQSYLETELDVQGVPRVNTPKLLLNELKRHQPDLIYIYARCEGEQILLDEDNSGKRSITLDELAQGLTESSIRPIVIISLLSKQCMINYPTKLIKQTSLLWMLTSTHDIKIQALENQLFSTFEQFTNNNDITATIKQVSLQQQQRRLQSIVWNNQQTPRLEIVDDKQRRKRQFRAALLKVVLGRNELKDRIAGGINRSLHQSDMLVYGITGTKSACPFDVPAQIRHHLEYASHQQLPFISHYFTIQIAPNPASNDIEDSIDNAISHTLLTGSASIRDTFHNEIERRGLKQDCCIALNWYFTVSADMLPQLPEWIERWDKVLCAEFNNVVPENALLVHALCLQLETPQDVGIAHQQARKILTKIPQDKQHCKKEYLRLSSPLGTLEESEINDFFDSDTLWRESLQLEQQQIDIVDFSHWIHTQTNGEFENVVNIIWQQYQHNYQEYKNQ